MHEEMTREFYRKNTSEFTTMSNRAQKNIEKWNFPLAHAKYVQIQYFLDEQRKK